MIKRGKTMKNIFLTIVLCLFAVGCETPLGPVGDDNPVGDDDVYWFVDCHSEENWYIENISYDNHWITEEECEEGLSTYVDRLQQDCYCTDGLDY